MSPHGRFVTSAPSIRPGPAGRYLRARGGIGRRAALRWQWVTPWGFESLRAHHFEKSTLITDARPGLAFDLACPSWRNTPTRTGNPAMKDRRLPTIALAFVFTLASTIALAGSVRHKPNAKAYDLRAPQVGSPILHPSYGNPEAPSPRADTYGMEEAPPRRVAASAADLKS